VRVSGGIVACVLSLGCAGTDVEVVPIDSGTPVVFDTAPFDEVVASIPRCGAGPFLLTGVRLSRGFGDRGALVGARVSVDACPDLVAETDKMGNATIATTVGVPYDFFLEHPEMPTEALGTFPGEHGVFTWMFQAANDPDKVPYDPAVPTLRVYALAVGTTPPCTVGGGLSVEVEGHPEARIRYFHDGVDIKAPDPALDTWPLIDGLPEGSVVSVIGKKAGCRVRKETKFRTGTHKLHKKFVTTVHLIIDNEPDAG
jgi:hypothetical protein